MSCIGDTWRPEKQSEVLRKCRDNMRFPQGVGFRCKGPGAKRHALAALAIPNCQLLLFSSRGNTSNEFIRFGAFPPALHCSLVWTKMLPDWLLHSWVPPPRLAKSPSKPSFVPSGPQTRSRTLCRKGQNFLKRTGEIKKKLTHRTLKILSSVYHWQRAVTLLALDSATPT